MPKNTVLKKIAIFQSQNLAITFLVFIGVLFPEFAYANTGIPMIFITFPSMLAALIPIILIETWICRSLLSIQYRKVLGPIVLANVASTFIGVPLSWSLLFGAQCLLGNLIGTIPQRFEDLVGALLAGGWISPYYDNFVRSELYWMIPIGSAIGVIAAYPISVWIESLVAGRFFEAGLRKAVGQAVQKANNVSYVLLLGLIAVWLARNIVWMQQTQEASKIARNLSDTIRTTEAKKIISKNKEGKILDREKAMFEREADYFHEFSEELALVVRVRQKTVRYEYINKQGQVVFVLNGVESGDFSQGLAQARTYVNGRLKYGYIDQTGAWVIPAQFDECKDFSEGLAAVGVVSEHSHAFGLSDWGYIDKMGKIIVPMKFTSADNFSEGLAAVSENRKYGYINPDGKFVIKPMFNDTTRFSNGVAVITQYDKLSFTNKYSFINKTGTKIASPAVAGSQ